MAVEYFNWQDAPQRDLWKELLPQLMTAVGKDAMDEISEASDGFTKVAVELKINGVAVDAKKFFSSYEAGLEGYVESRAAAYLSEKPEFRAIHELLEGFTEAMREKIYGAAAEAGVDIPERY